MVCASSRRNGEADSKVGTEEQRLQSIYRLVRTSKSQQKGLRLLKQKHGIRKGQTVLVVATALIVAEVTSSMFEHLGYETIYRDSAEAALKLLEPVRRSISSSAISSCQGHRRRRACERNPFGIPICRWPYDGYSDAAKELPQI